MPINIMFWIWLLLLIAFIVTELATAQLTTVWFAVGALISLILQMAGVKSIPIQVLVFIFVSLIALIATRPLVRKLTKNKNQPTNADMNIGKTAIVISDINNLEGSGQVKINGNVWSARSTDGEIISEGSTVTVQAIEGVKLIVK